MSHISHKIIKDKIIDQGAVILDLGGGDGKHSIRLADVFSAKVTLVDKKDVLSEQDKREIDFIQSDISEYKIKGTYDCIIANNVLSFLKSRADIKRVMKDAVRHLKPGGMFIFSLWGARHSWSDRHAVYTLDEIYEIIKDCYVYYKEEREGNMRVMNGEREYWHAYEFWVTNDLKGLPEVSK